jgi:hypothetical protein
MASPSAHLATRALFVAAALAGASLTSGWADAQDNFEIQVYGKGENTNRGFEFQPSIKIGYDITPRVSVGLEYYAALGPVTGFDQWNA